jgi:hypothetical protein
MDSIRNNYEINKKSTSSSVKYEFFMKEKNEGPILIEEVLETEDLLFSDHKQNAKDFIDTNFENWS